MSDVFIEVAKRLQFSLPISLGHQLVDTGRKTYSINDPDLPPLLMLAVLEKMGWGIDYYPKTAAPGWWFGSMEFEAQGPFAFSDLPEAVCKAFVEAEE